MASPHDSDISTASTAATTSAVSSVLLVVNLDSHVYVLSLLKDLKEELEINGGITESLKEKAESAMEVMHMQTVLIWELDHDRSGQREELERLRRFRERVVEAVRNEVRDGKGIGRF